MRAQFFDLLADVRRARLGGAGPKVVLMVLAEHAGVDENGDWSCYPSQVAIAEVAELSERQVRRILAAFAKAGLISKQVRQAAQGRGRASDLITLNWPAIVALGSAEPTEDSGRPTGHPTHDQPDILSGERARPTGHSEHDQPDIGDTTNRTLATLSGDDPLLLEVPVRANYQGSNKRARKSTVALDSAPPAQICAVGEPTFDDFWAVWPRKEAKLVARKAWDKATEGTPAASIVAGAVRYADDPNREQSHTAHAATWLNGERWEDDALPARNGRTKTDRSMDAIAAVLLNGDRPAVEAKAR